MGIEDFAVNVKAAKNVDKGDIVAIGDDGIYSYTGWVDEAWPYNSNVQVYVENGKRTDKTRTSFEHDTEQTDGLGSQSVWGNKDGVV